MGRPPSMKWAEKFAQSINRALLGDVYGWDVLEQEDPLRRVLHLRLHRKFRKEEVPFIRSLLKAWCEANDCVYRKSDYKGRDLKALIVLKGLGPERDESPYS